MEKKVVSRSEFDKRVESEYCWLIRWEYMKKGEAWAKANQIVAANFVSE